jgi:peptidoglycan/xylan/chitin deacetylase (PgdA/CDA1 family)
VTIDDLPIASSELHPDPADRERITGELLAVLAKHRIRAVGLVTWRNFRGPADQHLLEHWIDAGHELGNHSWGHLDYTATDSTAYIADVEHGRARLAELAESRGSQVRFFRFPFLREGETAEKLAAMRRYLEASGQRNLPVTLDTQDWSFESPWVEAKQAGDTSALDSITGEYLSQLRLEVVDQEQRGDRLLGRTTPQILLLHANAVGAAQWDALFSWLEGTGHRFATADEVLADPAYALPHDFVGRYGCGLWDRLVDARRREAARAAITELLVHSAAAWNRGDLEAFCSDYAEDALFVSPSGTTRGRSAVLSRYRAKYHDRAAMGTLSFELLEVRLTSGMEVSILGGARPAALQGASLVVRWSLAFADSTTSGLTLLVLRPRGKGWEIVQDASM